MALHTNNLCNLVFFGRCRSCFGRDLGDIYQLDGSHCSRGVANVPYMEDTMEDTEQVLANVESGMMTPTEKVEGWGPLRNTMAEGHC